MSREGTGKAVNRSATPGGAKGSCAPDDRRRSGKMMTSDLRRTGSASVSRQPKEQLEGREGRKGGKAEAVGVGGGWGWGE